MEDKRTIVFFDGHCNLCNSSVNFIIDRDKSETIYFAALQSDFGKAFVIKHGIEETVSSIIFFEKNRLYTESSAAIRISRKLDGLWPVLYVFIFVPKFFRDLFYRFIAKNRYIWFGKSNVCRLSENGLQHRFLSE